MVVLREVEVVLVDREVLVVDVVVVDTVVDLEVEVEVVVVIIVVVDELSVSPPSASPRLV